MREERRQSKMEVDDDDENLSTDEIEQDDASELASYFGDTDVTKKWWSYFELLISYLDNFGGKIAFKFFFGTVMTSVHMCNTFFQLTTKK